MSETILSFLLGIGLSAAAGFRVFVPMLVVSLASMAGWITLSPGFQWMGTPVAALVFAVATLVELLSFLVPWVSNALDSIATPAAAIAGAIIMAPAIAAAGVAILSSALLTPGTRKLSSSTKVATANTSAATGVPIH